MNPINFAIRRARTVRVLLLAIVMAGISVIRPPTVDHWLRERGVLLWQCSRQIGVEIFPTIDAGEFRLRMRAADGTHIDSTEAIAKQVLETIGDVVGNRMFV